MSSSTISLKSSGWLRKPCQDENVLALARASALSRPASTGSPLHPVSGHPAFRGRLSARGRLLFSRALASSDPVLPVHEKSGCRRVELLVSTKILQFSQLQNNPPHALAFACRPTCRSASSWTQGIDYEQHGGYSHHRKGTWKRLPFVSGQWRSATIST